MPGAWGQERSAAPRVVERPATRILRERSGRRPLIVVDAGPGWGKTALVAGWAEEVGAAWLSVTPRHADASALAADLEAALVATTEGRPPDREEVADRPAMLVPTGGSTDAIPPTDDPDRLGGDAARLAEVWRAVAPPAVVLDDVHHLTGTDGGALLRRVAAARPTGAQLCLTTQRGTELVDARARGAGSVLHLDATHLAMDGPAIAALLADDLDPDEVLAVRIAEQTGGWPAAVRLVLDGLFDVPPDRRVDRLAALAGPAGPISAYLRDVVLPGLDPTSSRRLAELALLGLAGPTRFAAGCGLARHEAEEALDALVSMGLARRHATVEDPAAVTLAPAIRNTVLARHLPARDDADTLVGELVGRLTATGDLADAARVLVLTGRWDDVAALLDEHGETLLHAGHLEVVRDAVDALPAGARTAPRMLLLAHAAGYLGEWERATAALEAAGADVPGPLPAEVALALGIVHHLRGDLAGALDAYRRADAPDGPVAAELTGWSSTAHWLRAEIDEARRLATQVMEAAVALRDDRLLALAHTAAALVAASDGDRAANEAHYDRALAAARRAGDGLQEVRILTNRGSLHLEEGRFEAARVETEAAIDLAETQRSVQIGAIARCNRAEILLRTGALDEAIADAEIARDRFAAIGSKHESYAHHLLGDARRERGELVLARRAYERSLRLAEPSGDRQGRIPALIGLVRTLSGSDPEEAARIAERAIALDDGMYRASALLAAGWAALASGDPTTARQLVGDAEREAIRRGDRTALAEAATLGALLADDPRPGLREAASQWRELDARISATRVELGLLRRSPRAADRSRAAALERQLLSWGCAIDHGAFAHVAVLGVADHPRCAVRVLGEFSVEHDGQPVPAAAWGSRKARDLLKILVTRSARGATREELADLLWPDEPYDAVSNRLSVALSVVRGVLAPKDAPRSGTSAIMADGAAIRLDTDHVDVDLERFQRLADAGLQAARSGREGERAVELLAAAEQAYGGDLLEHDHDADWLVDRREQLRSTYVSVARTLADLVVDTDPDLTVRLLLRVLDRDPYDEPAHLGVCAGLLRAGRHGEARRRHRLYVRRMADLDLPAVPFSEVMAAPRSAPRIVSA